MAIDALTLAAVRQELEAGSVGARITRVWQPDRDVVCLALRCGGQEQLLLLSAEADQARVHLTQERLPAPALAPTFCMVLRKYLEGGRLTAVEQPPWERVLTLVVTARDELGRPRVCRLVSELMGRHSNLILLDGEGVILDGLKRYSFAVNSYREVLPGRAYCPPPTQERCNPFSLATPEDLAGVLLPLLSTEGPVRALVGLLPGLGPSLARELLARAALAPDAAQGWGLHEFTRLWQEVLRLYGDVSAGNFQPVTYYDATGWPLTVAPFPLATYADFACLPASGINAALDAFHTSRRRRQVLAHREEELRRAIGRAQRHAGELLALQRQVLATSARAEELRRAGEAITANIYRLSRGEIQLLAEDYYRPGNRPLVIELDPQLTPAANAQAYFKKYRKALAAANHAQGQIAGLEDELWYLASLEQTLDLARSEEDLAEIAVELAAEGYLPQARQQGRPGTGTAKKQGRENGVPDPLRFSSSDGATILVGKNNRQNDRLTLRLAQGDDLWLHVKDLPGAHVVVKGNGTAVTPTTLEEAARLAAYFSKARDSSKVPVDYTAVAHVRKPRGARPGMVVYDHQRTLVVDPQGGPLPRRLEGGD